MIIDYVGVKEITGSLIVMDGGKGGGGGGAFLTRNLLTFVLITVQCARVVSFRLKAKE